MEVKNKIELIEIKTPNLTPAEFGENICEQFENINKNFNLLANHSFLKGDKGNSIIYQKIKLSDDEKLKYSIINKIKENVAIDALEPICLKHLIARSKYGEFESIGWDDNLNDMEIQIIKDEQSDLFVSSLPILFIDKRFYNKNGLTDNIYYKNLKLCTEAEAYKNLIDLTCILIVEPDGNDYKVSKLNNMYPTLYFDQNIDEFCWKYNNEKTGLTAKGPKGDSITAEWNIFTVKINSGNDNLNIQSVLYNGNWYNIDEYIAQVQSDKKETVGFPRLTGNNVSSIALVFDDNRQNKCWISPIWYDELQKTYGVNCSDGNSINILCFLKSVDDLFNSIYPTNVTGAKTIHIKAINNKSDETHVMYTDRNGELNIATITSYNEVFGKNNYNNILKYVNNKKKINILNDINAFQDVYVKGDLIAGLENINVVNKIHEFAGQIAELKKINKLPYIDKIIKLTSEQLSNNYKDERYDGNGNVEILLDTNTKHIVFKPANSNIYWSKCYLTDETEPYNEANRYVFFNKENNLLYIYLGNPVVILGQILTKYTMHKLTDVICELYLLKDLYALLKSDIDNGNTNLNNGTSWPGGDFAGFITEIDHALDVALSYPLDVPKPGLDGVEIYFDRTNLEYVLGSEKTFETPNIIINNPNPNYFAVSEKPEYSSSNPDVALVDENGDVIIQGVGSAIIFATIEVRPILGNNIYFGFNWNRTASYSIDVRKNNNKLFYWCDADGNNTSDNICEVTFNNKNNIFPALYNETGLKPKFSSSDTKIAYFENENNNVLIIEKPGTTFITAETSSQEKYSTTYTLNIKPQKNQDANIENFYFIRDGKKIEEEYYRLNTGDYISPSLKCGHRNGIIYESSNAIASVDENGSVKINKYETGDVVIKATYEATGQVTQYIIHVVKLVEPKFIFESNKYTCKISKNYDFSTPIVIENAPNLIKLPNPADEYKKYIKYYTGIDEDGFSEDVWVCKTDDERKKFEDNGVLTIHMLPKNKNYVEIDIYAKPIGKDIWTSIKKSDAAHYILRIERTEWDIKGPNGNGVPSSFGPTGDAGQNRTKEILDTTNKVHFSTGPSQTPQEFGNKLASVLVNLNKSQYDLNKLTLANTNELFDKNGNSKLSVLFNPNNNGELSEKFKSKIDKSVLDYTANYLATKEGQLTLDAAVRDKVNSYFIETVGNQNLPEALQFQSMLTQHMIPHMIPYMLGTVASMVLECSLNMDVNDLRSEQCHLKSLIKMKGYNIQKLSELQNSKIITGISGSDLPVNEYKPGGPATLSTGLTEENCPVIQGMIDDAIKTLYDNKIKPMEKQIKDLQAEVAALKGQTK